jgi:3-oxoacyl-[acyl-carrier protein] reductase
MNDLRTGGLGIYALSGKVAVVSGGSSGIGAATARRLAAAGAKVAVGYNKGLERAEAVIAQLPGEGHRALHLPMEDSEALRRAAAQVREAYGRCDVLVNSAGITRAVPHADLDALDDETFDRIYRINVRGPFATMRAFVPLLRESGDAVIVNLSSISAFTGSGSSIAYCASKAALDTMGLSLARVLGPQIRVITLSPAAVDTDFVPGRGRAAIEKQASSTPLRVVVDPDDVAVSVIGAITHLRLATGTTVVIDGGKHL